MITTEIINDNITEYYTHSIECFNCKSEMLRLSTDNLDEQYGHYCCPVCGASITVFQIEEN